MADQDTGKKGMHPMAWVGIGCGGIVLIGVVVVALLVGWCSKKVDEVARMEISEGKFSITTDEGTMEVDRDGSGATVTGTDGQKATYGIGGLERMPKMFEIPKGVTGWASMMHSERNGKTTGMVRGESSEALADLDEAFTQALTVAGFTEMSRVTVAQTTNLSFAHKEKNQNVTVSLLEEGAKRMVQLTYVEN